MVFSPACTFIMNMKLSDVCTYFRSNDAMSGLAANDYGYSHYGVVRSSSLPPWRILLIMACLWASKK